jgi:hypothetical protein
MKEYDKRKSHRSPWTDRVNLKFGNIITTKQILIY